MVPARKRENITTGQETIKNCDKFKYLDLTLTTEGTSSKDTNKIYMKRNTTRMLNYGAPKSQRK